MVHALCQPKNSQRARDWVMSVPARPDYDPDLVIAAGLNAGDRVRRMLPAIADLVEAAEACASAHGPPRVSADPLEGMRIHLMNALDALAQAMKEVE